MISNHQYLTEVFQLSQKKLGITAGCSTFAMEAIKMNVLIWGRSCLRQWKPPFILTRIIWRTWRSTRIRTFSEIQSLFNITQKFIWEHSEEILNVNTVDSALLHGEDRYCLTIKWFSGQRQKSTCLLGFRSVPGKDVCKQRFIWKMGRSNGGIQNVTFFQRIAGNRWRSNWVRVEYFPRIFDIADSSKNQGWFAREEHRPRKIHRPEHLHVNVCSMTSIGQKKEMMEFVFRIQIKSRITRRDSCKDTGRFWVLERKRSGMEFFLTHLRENEIPQPISWWKDSKTQVTQSLHVPVLRVVEFWERWKEKKPCTSMRILQTQNSFFWTLHSVNRLSIYGAVSNWCEQFGLTEEEKGQEKPQESVTKDVVTCVKSQEVKLLASPPKLAFGNSLQENIHDFESLDEKIQFTRVCELALFKHRVSAGRKYKTRPDGSWFHFADNTHFLKHTHNPETLQQSLEEQLLDQ